MENSIYAYIIYIFFIPGLVCWLALAEAALIAAAATADFRLTALGGICGVATGIAELRPVGVTGAGPGGGGWLAPARRRLGRLLAVGGRFEGGWWRWL